MRGINEPLIENFIHVYLRWSLRAQQNRRQLATLPHRSSYIQSMRWCSADGEVRKNSTTFFFIPLEYVYASIYDFLKKTASLIHHV